MSSILIIFMTKLKLQTIHVGRKVAMGWACAQKFRLSNIMERVAKYCLRACHP